jgi:SSS family solute:Na+ symporter
MAIDWVTTAIYWVVFVGYLVWLMWVGIRSHEKTKTFNDFMNAGRSIGPLLLGLSFGVTYFSAVMIVGGGEYSFVWGLSSIWIAVIDCVVGVFAMFIMFGKRTMKMSEELGTITVAEMIGKRYQSKAVRQSTALATLVFETIYLVSIFMGLSVLIKYVMPGIDPTLGYTIAVILCGVVTVIYLNVGGSHGAIATDVVESLIMIAGVLVVFIFGLIAVGGVDGLITRLQQIALAPKLNGGMGSTNINALTTAPPGSSPMGWLGYVLVTSFGVWGMPQMISRYFTANKNKAIRGGLVISVIWALACSLLAWWNGAIGRAYFWDGTKSTLPANFTSDEIVPKMITVLLAGAPWAVAIFIAAVAAASLTTGEKVILVASSAFSRDFYQLQTKVSDEKGLRMTRIMNMVIVVIAVILALQNLDAVLALCMFAWAALAAVVLVPYVYGLFWKGGTAKAAFITGMVSLAIALLWKLLVKGFNSPAYPHRFPDPLLYQWSLNPIYTGSTILFKDIHEFMISQVFAVIAFPIISILTKKSINKEYVNTLFDVITEKKPIGSTASFQDITQGKSTGPPKVAEPNIEEQAPPE